MKQSYQKAFIEVSELSSTDVIMASGSTLPTEENKDNEFNFGDLY